MFYQESFFVHMKFIQSIGLDNDLICLSQITIGVT